jgi:hypothetical protein
MVPGEEKKTEEKWNYVISRWLTRKFFVHHQKNYIQPSLCSNVPNKTQIKESPIIVASPIWKIKNVL